MQGQLLHFIWHEHTLQTCGTFDVTEYIANSRDTALNFLKSFGTRSKLLLLYFGKEFIKIERDCKLE